MQNIPDEKLDKLFQLAASSYDAPFDEDAWKAMEKKLDKADGNGFGKGRMLYTSVLLVLLVGIGITLFMLREKEVAVQKVATDFPTVEDNMPVNKNNLALNENPDENKSESIGQTDRVGAMGNGIDPSGHSFHGNNKKSSTSGNISQDTGTEGQNSTMRKGDVSSKAFNDKGGKSSKADKGKSDIGAGKVVADNNQTKWKTGGSTVGNLGGSANGAEDSISLAKGKAVEGAYYDGNLQMTALGTRNNEGAVKDKAANIAEEEVTGNIQAEQEKVLSVQVNEVGGHEEDVAETKSADKKNQNEEPLVIGIVKNHDGQELIEEKGMETTNNEDIVGLKDAEKEEVGTSGKPVVFVSNRTRRGIGEVNPEESGVNEEENVTFEKDDKGYGVWAPPLVPALTFDHNWNINELPEVDMNTVDVNTVKMEGLIDEEQKKINNSFKSSFAIKFSYAPDLSSVGLFRPDGLGNNFGGSLEYNFLSRWSLSVGALYSKKLYFANEGRVDYTSIASMAGGGGYGGNNPWKLKRVTADCDVVDIPINLTYSLKMKEKYSFFVSSGLSSYLMLREDYQLELSRTGASDSRRALIKNENSHYFGVMNISAGYERKLGTRYSFQLEPFLKVPITGIGEGDANLLSTGAYFSLKYQLVR